MLAGNPSVGHPLYYYRAMAFIQTVAPIIIWGAFCMPNLLTRIALHFLNHRVLVMPEPAPYAGRAPLSAMETPFLFFYGAIAVNPVTINHRRQ